jgi:nicotinamidase-related amidase
MAGKGGTVANGGPPQNDDLHGSVPDQAPVALLLIDVINTLDFPGNEEIVQRVGPMAARITALKARARAVGIPAVYVNDNFGRWRSDQRALLDHALQTGSGGQAMVEALRPEEDDYFVLKPKHSAFFSTTLDTLLAYLGARTLILTGVAGNICVFFSANDAYMRDFGLVVPKDCVASNTVAENDYALAQMRQILRADTTSSPDLDLERLLHAAHASRPSPYAQGASAASVAQGQRAERG